METNVNVTEFTTFESAWQAATKTKESFDYYQGMAGKINYIRLADRWFVDLEAGELYYSYLTDDKLRIVKKADPISMLSDGKFRYIQIMVSDHVELNPSRKGTLRFTDSYVTRAEGIKLSSEGVVYAFDR